MTSKKSFVVTGSTRGIGRGIALELLKRGHDVAISGRSAAAVEAAVRELSTAAAPGARAIGSAGEVSSWSDMERLWSEASKAFGKVDVWVNNAGVSHERQLIGELRANDVSTVAHTNLTGMMFATQIAMRGMRDQPSGGVIYNMEGFGSNGMTTAGMSLYGASKFALTYFNKCLMAETKGDKVRICWLSPGIVITDLLKRDMGSTSEAEWERTKRIYNILADRVETVTPYLAEGIIANEKAGARVAWLTGKKAALRFMTAGFTKRKVLRDEDFAPGN